VGGLWVARVRAGSLSHDRLRLLARLGDPTARLFLGGIWPAPERADELLVGLRPFANRGLMLRSVLGVAELAVPAWEANTDSRLRAQAREAIDGARAWLLAILEGHEEVEVAARAKDTADRVLYEALHQPEPALSAGRAVSEPATTIAATGGRFLSSAEVTVELVEAAGVGVEAIREAVLSAVRESSLDE